MEPRRFFEELIPRAWNERADGVERMRGSQFGLTIEVDTEAFHLSVLDGTMRVADGPSELTVAQLLLGSEDFQQLARQIGPSPMALFGGIIGQADYALTPERVTKLRALGGTLGLEITGDGGWSLRLQLGPGPRSTGNDVTLVVPADTYRRIGRGELDLQRAFLGGQLKVSGKTDLLLKLAMALVI